MRSHPSGPNGLISIQHTKLILTKGLFIRCLCCLECTFLGSFHGCQSFKAHFKYPLLMERHPPPTLSNTASFPSHSSFIRLYFLSALITLKSLFACLSSLFECTFMRTKDLVWPMFCYVPSAQQYLCVADAPKICAKGTKLGQTLVADATCPGGKQFKKHNTGSLPARGLHLYYAIILRIIQCCNIEIELRGHHLLLSPFLPLAEWFWMASICTINFFLFFNSVYTS